MIETSPRELNIPAHKIGVFFKLGINRPMGIDIRYPKKYTGIVTKVGMELLSEVQYSVKVIDEAVIGQGVNPPVTEFVGAQINNVLTGAGFTEGVEGNGVLYPSGEMALITKYVDPNTVYVDLDRDILFTPMKMVELGNYLDFEDGDSDDYLSLEPWGVSNYTEFNETTGILKVHDFRVVGLDVSSEVRAISELGCRPSSGGISDTPLFAMTTVDPPVYISPYTTPVCLMELVREFDCNEYYVDNCNISGINSSVRYRFNLDRLDENLFLSRTAPDGMIDSPINGSSIIERGSHDPNSLILMLNQHEETPSIYGNVGPANDLPDVMLNRQAKKIISNDDYLFILFANGIEVYELMTQDIPVLINTINFTTNNTTAYGLLLINSALWVMIDGEINIFDWNSTNEELTHIAKHYVPTAPLMDSNSFVQYRRGFNMLYTATDGSVNSITTTDVTAPITIEKYDRYDDTSVFVDSGKYSHILVASELGNVTLIRDINDKYWSLDIGYFGKPIQGIILDNLDIVIRTNENKMLLLRKSSTLGVLTLLDTIDNITTNIGYAGGDFILVEDPNDAGSSTPYIVDNYNLVPLGYTEKISASLVTRNTKFFSIGANKLTLSTNLSYFYVYSVGGLKRKNIDSTIDLLHGNIEPPSLDVPMRELHITDSTEENSLLRIIFNSPQETIMRSLTGFNLYSKWNRIF